MEYFQKIYVNELLTASILPDRIDGTYYDKHQEELVTVKKNRLNKLDIRCPLGLIIETRKKQSRYTFEIAFPFR